MPSPTPIGQNRFSNCLPTKYVFTDREEPQQVFKDALNEIKQRDFNLLVYYGVGGIGKSFLQAHLKQEHLDKDANSLYSSVDFKNTDNRTLAKTLRSLVHNFSGEPTIPFTAFGLAYMIYWEKAFPAQDIKKAGLPFLEEGSLLAGAADIAIDIAEGVPGASVAVGALEYLYNKAKQRAFDESLRDALEQLNNLNSDQIEKELPQYFAYDIEQYQAKHPEKNIVIFIDTHEALWQIKRNEANRLTEDQWLRDGIIALLHKVLFVISGRERLVWEEDKSDNWGDILKDHQHLLGNLSDNDARDYLKNYAINDADIQDKIIADSEGVPFYLSLSMETFYKIKQQGKSPCAEDFAAVGQHELFERFMHYLDHDESETLKILAHARFYTAELFSLLVEEFKTGYPISAMSQLHQFSFISQAQGHYFLHDLMRKNLIEHQDKASQQAVNQYLFDYYQQYLQDLNIKQLSETTLLALPEAFYYKSLICGVEELSDWFFEHYKIFKDAAQYIHLLESTRQLIDLCKEKLGKEHLYTGAGLHNLADLYRHMGKYEEAEPLYQQSLEIIEKALGKDHLAVATSLNNLAGLYKSQGKHEKAQLLYQQSLDIREKVLGKNHPDVAQSLNNLAELYRTQNKYEEAEPLYQQSLNIREKALEKDHPDVATSLNNLALLYGSQGKYEEAEPLYQQSLKIWEKVLGKDHPSMAVSLNNLALLYESQDKYEEAESLYQRSLGIKEKALEKNHPSIVTSLNNLARLY